MSFERFKFWRTSNTEGLAKEEDSLISQAQNMMNNYLKKTQPNIDEFEDYLCSIPESFGKRRKTHRQSSTTTTSLKPQLVKRCYELVAPLYFDPQFAIQGEFFTRNKKNNRETHAKLHQDLDEVEICLFNQISSRFDEILSVLRTIQSLECIVEDNLKSIRKIRGTNLSSSKTAAQKQCQVVQTVHKKNRIQATLLLLSNIKRYRDFQLEQRESIQITDQGSYYSSIQQLKESSELYRKLNCIPQIDDKIDEYEGALKKSFSDSINDSMYKYITEIVPYEKTFWGRMQYKMDMFEQDRRDGDGTVILDESVLIEEEHVVVIKLVPEKEGFILENLKRGWVDGQYNVGGLKSKIDSFLRTFHNNFLQDYRNFCVEMCQRFQKNVQNPSLSNLLNLMTVNFCIRIFQYFNDAHKNLLQRLFSVINRCIKFVMSQSEDSQKTIEQKQKLTNMLDGLVNTESFVFKIIADKMSDLIDMKVIFETTDLVEFKTLISVLEAEEEFIEKKLTPLSTYSISEESFLSQRLAEIQSKIGLGIITKNKNRKLRSYLNQMHKFVVQSELKDNLQNEIWQPIDIPTFYYDSLHYLISGQSLNLRRNKMARTNSSFNGSMLFESSVLMDSVPNQSVPMKQTEKSIIGNFRIIRNEITIQGKIYKVTQTVLLIIQILQDYLNLVQSYPVLKQEVALKMNQLLRSYNSSSCQLIIHAGAVVLGKIRTKNITSKHLALSSLCLSFLLYLMECILKRAEISDSQRLMTAIRQHMNSTIKKLEDILINKVRNSLGEINLDNSPSKGTEIIVNSTKILHDILIDYYQKPTLRFIFTKESVRLYVDRIGTLKVSNRLGAQALKDDITFYFTELRFLNDLVPEFSAMRIEAEDSVRRAFQSL